MAKTMKELKAEASAIHQTALKLAKERLLDLEAVKMIAQPDGTPINAASQALYLEKLRLKAQAIARAGREAVAKLDADLPRPDQVGVAGWLGDASVRFTPTLPPAPSYVSDHDKQMRVVLATLMEREERDRRREEADSWRRLTHDDDVVAAIESLMQQREAPDFTARVRIAREVLDTRQSSARVRATLAEALKANVPAQFTEREAEAKAVATELHHARTFLNLAEHAQRGVPTQDGGMVEFIKPVEAPADVAARAKRLRPMLDAEELSAPPATLPRIELKAEDASPITHH